MHGPGIVRLAQRARETWRRWRAADQNLRALAAVDDNDLHHLSEAGQKLRARVRRQFQSPHQPSAKSGE